MTEPNPQIERPVPQEDSQGFLGSDAAVAHIAQEILGVSDPEQASNSEEEMSAEARATNMIVETYFDNFMANPHWGNFSGDPEKLAEYRRVFTDVATHYFEGVFLRTDRYERQEYNPILGELNSMMASLSHNVGVYYTEEDVPEIFTVVATHILDGKEFQGQLQEASDKQDVNMAENAFKSAVEETTSLDHERSLAIVKDGDGTWRVANDQEYAGTQDFMPLEVLRQDNADKGGWNKYRFRTPNYTRTQDELHPHEVSKGWYTSEWHTDPNYWSSHIREAFVEGLLTVESQLKETGVEIMLVSEGGVAKGTSTAGTDIDTMCIVVGDIATSFGQAETIVDPIFADKLAHLPFALKKGEQLRPRFYDRATGIAFDRNPKTGKFVALPSNGLFNGRFVFKIRQHEKVIGVTKASGFATYKKPDDTDPKRSLFAVIDVANGEIHPMNSEDAEAYKTLQETRKLAMIADNVDENWLW